MDNNSKAQKRAAFCTAFITASTIFIMGFVNGMALHTYQLSAMVTAQSGNVIWMGLNPVFALTQDSSYWASFASTLMLFFGFVFGCGFAVMTLAKFTNKLHQFFFNWAFFALPVALYPFYMQFINSQFAFLMMGLSAGFGVGFFRRMYHLDQINNAMATGSVRFLGVHFAGAFLKKNKAELFTLWIFVICVLMFSLGAALFAFASHLDYSTGIVSEQVHRLFVRQDHALFSITHITLLVICVIPMFFAPGTILKENK